MVLLLKRNKETNINRWLTNNEFIKIYNLDFFGSTLSKTDINAAVCCCCCCNKIIFILCIWSSWYFMVLSMSWCCCSIWEFLVASCCYIFKASSSSLSRISFSGFSRRYFSASLPLFRFRLPPSSPNIVWVCLRLSIAAFLIPQMQFFDLALTFHLFIKCSPLMTLLHFHSL